MYIYIDSIENNIYCCTIDVLQYFKYYHIRQCTVFMAINFAINFVINLKKETGVMMTQCYGGEHKTDGFLV